MNLLLYAFSFLSNRFLQKFRYLFYKIGLAGMGYGYGIGFQDHAKEIAYKKLGYNISKKQFIFFDVGANIGQTIDGFNSKKMGKTIIYSFEPQKSAYKKLKTKESDAIKTYNIGLSNIIGESYIYTSDEQDVSGSIVGKESHTGGEKIQINTIDNFCFNNNISYISYLKIDTEGTEYDILQGAKKMIESGKIEAIEFEFLWQNLYSRHFFKDFWDLLQKDYIIYRILPRDIYRIRSYSHLLEIYCLSNFLCIKKQ